MKSTLFVGDINVDLMLGGLERPPVTDREVACSSFSLTMGSSAVITAANYVGLGGRAAVAGLTGEDEYGRYMIAAMKERGIDTALVQTTAEVGTGVTVNLIYRQTRTQITYPGAIARFEDISAIERNLDRFSHIHFSGVYQQHRFRPKLTDLLAASRRSGASVSLDTQWDPREEWERLDEWLPALDYLFVNEDEALSITGTANAHDALARLMGRTACPVCKLGERGALVAVAGSTIAVPPPRRVVVRDSTGAGDAFAAGFLYARLERGMAVADAARIANAAGAHNCLMEGGVNACPSFDELANFAAGEGGE